MDRLAALKQIDEAIAMAANIREDKGPSREMGAHITEYLFSTIGRFIPNNSTYKEKIKQLRAVSANSYEGYVIPQLVGVLRALRAEIGAGYIERLSSLARADTFSDFLTMSQHLLEEGYKDPAAVLAGSVLEQHLRALCAANDIEATLPDGRWKKADALNAELAREEIYSKLNQKNVTSWLGLRNEAAHGNYANYEAANVRLMLDGISLFMIQHPA